MKNDKKNISYIVLVSCFFVFSVSLLTVYHFGSFERFFNSIVCFIKSFIFYFESLFSNSNNLVPPTTFYDDAVNNVYDIRLPIPTDVNILFMWFKSQFFVVFSKDYFKSSFQFIGNILRYANIIIFFALSFALLCFTLNNFLFIERDPLKRGYSKGFINFRNIKQKYYNPVRNYVLGFIDFNKKHIWIFKLLVLVFCFYLNIVSVVIDAFSYLLVLFVTFNPLLIWKFAYSSIYSLIPIFTSIPLIFWLVIIYSIYCYFRRRKAINILAHHDYLNREFVDGLGIAVFCKGTSGKGKDLLLVDMTLCDEENKRYKLLDILDKYKILFNNFDFKSYFKFIDLMKNLKDENIRFNNHFDVLRFVNKTEDYFYEGLKKDIDISLFNFDLSNFNSFVKDDGVNVISFFTMLSDVGVAYFYYGEKKPLCISNFSIKFDYLVNTTDYGVDWNFPYFTINPFESLTVERYSTPINQDSLRFGKTFNDPNKSCPIGMYSYYISEEDKEWPNQFGLVGLKISDFETNLLNDYHAYSLKFGRHAGMIDHKTFIRFFSNAQRVGSTNSDFIESNESILSILEKANKCAFKGWFIERIICEFMINQYSKFRRKYTESRNFISLLYLFVSNFYNIFSNYYTKIGNKYCYEQWHILVEDGSFTQKKDAVYYLSYKKAYANRYPSDFLKGYFMDKYKDNKVSFHNLPTYSGLYPSSEELLSQNSYMVKNLYRLKNANDVSSDDVNNVVVSAENDNKKEGV